VDNEIALEPGRMRGKNTKFACLEQAVVVDDMGKDKDGLVEDSSEECDEMRLDDRICPRRQHVVCLVDEDRVACP